MQEAKVKHTMTNARHPGSHREIARQGRGVMLRRLGSACTSCALRVLLALAIAVLLLALARPAAAEQVFFDRAKVVSVTAVEQTLRRPVVEERCDTIIPRRDHARIAAWSGDVRARAPGISLADALREDRRLFLQRPLPEERCRRVTVMREAREPAYYQVEYRYGGRTFVRQMSEHPGEWVKVRVRMGDVR